MMKKLKKSNGIKNLKYAKRYFKILIDQIDALPQLLFSLTEYKSKDLTQLASLIETKAYRLIYLLFLGILLLSYCFLAQPPNLLEKVVFVMLTLYLCTKGLSKIFLLSHQMELFLGILVVFVVSLKDSTVGIFCSTALIIVCQVFVKQLSLGVGINFVMSFLISLAAPSKRWLKFWLCMALYCLILFLNQMYRSINQDAFRRIKNAQEDMKKASENQTRFVACVSHDLKNPLNSFLGCIDQLKHSASLNRAERAKLETANYSVKVMNYLIGSILDISKIEVGKFEVDWKPMNFLQELRKIMKIELEQAKKRGINLYRKCLSSIPKCVLADPMRFTQILLNLIGNSVKFTSRGYVAVLVFWVDSCECIKTEEEKFRKIYGYTDLIPSEDFFRPASPVNRSRTDFFKAKSRFKHFSTEVISSELAEDEINEENIGDITLKLGKYKFSTRFVNGTNQRRFSRFPSQLFGGESQLMSDCYSLVPNLFSPDMQIGDFRKEEEKKIPLKKPIRAKKESSQSIVHSEFEDQEINYKDGESGILLKLNVRKQNQMEEKNIK